MPNAILEKLWSHILADFITKLPLAQGYDAILVVCNCFSKMAHFIATMEKRTCKAVLRSCMKVTWTSRKHYISVMRAPNRKRFLIYLNT